MSSSVCYFVAIINCIQVERQYSKDTVIHDTALSTLQS